jgi:hypothetical protein
MADKAVNNINSQNDVITTMTHALMAFEEMVKIEMPDVAVVYDEQLSYETAVEQIMANSNYNRNEQRPMPFLAYNRTVLVESDTGIGKRSRTLLGNLKIGNKRLIYSATHGEFEIQFFYCSTSIEQTEKFEVVYNSEEGITGSKELIVNMGDEIGEFKYYLDYQELTEKIIEKEDSYYKAIIGTIKVRGFYFTFRGESGVIEQINQKIYASKWTNPENKTDIEKIGDVTIT